MKRVKATATGVVWTFDDELADSLLLRQGGEFVEVEDEPRAEPRKPAKRAPSKPEK